MSMYDEGEASSLLEMNMNIISNELNGLVMANELCEVGTPGAKAATLEYYSREWTAAPRQAQFCGYQGHQVQANHFHPPNPPKHHVPYCQQPCPVKRRVFPIADSSYLVGMASVASTSIGSQKENIPPENAAFTKSSKCELYYLPSNKLSRSHDKVPLINRGVDKSGACAGFRYANGVGGEATRKHRHRHKCSKKPDHMEKIDYDSIVVNMEELGFTDDIGEKNPVLRLSGLFRMLNHYLQDVFPFVLSINGNPVEPIPIPRTMNMQQQVKHAAHNCTAFIIDREYILYAKEPYDLDQYTECQKSLYAMRKLCAELEPYKHAYLEHRKCQFITDEGRANAKQLKDLLERLSDQVRDCNLLIHVYDWTSRTENQRLIQNLLRYGGLRDDLQCDNENNVDGGFSFQSQLPEGKEADNSQSHLRYIG